MVRRKALVLVAGGVGRVTNMSVDRRFSAPRQADPQVLVADNEAILAERPWKPERDCLDTIVAERLRGNACSRAGPEWNCGHGLGPDGEGPGRERIV
jgi:UDP-glucose 4-epimerase